MFGHNYRRATAEVAAAERAKRLVLEAARLHLHLVRLSAACRGDPARRDRLNRLQQRAQARLERRIAHTLN